MQETVPSHLYNLLSDPGETTDLAEILPDKVQARRKWHLIAHVTWPASFQELTNKLLDYQRSMVTPFNCEYAYENGDPANFGRVYGPGGCQAQEEKPLCPGEYGEEVEAPSVAPHRGKCSQLIAATLFMALAVTRYF